MKENFSDEPIKIKKELKTFVNLYLRDWFFWKKFRLAIRNSSWNLLYEWN